MGEVPQGTGFVLFFLSFLDYPGMNTMPWTHLLRGVITNHPQEISLTKN